MELLVSVNATCLILVAVSSVWVMQRDMIRHNLIARFIIAGVGASATAAAGDNLINQAVPLISTVMFHSFMAAWAVLAMSPAYKTVIRR